MELTTEMQWRKWAADEPTNGSNCGCSDQATVAAVAVGSIVGGMVASESRP